ncbi:hypothetical protein OPV22_026830 [Ensete ventricosum]|uniref:Uncharacterized protein n=1 Tax=Ensete ventricosum TaxID=4639 RepID=A0AAV8Q276_ENSVE|nr:hypothetical protein OPV22_026830 [Ensete ventricosum]
MTNQLPTGRSWLLRLSSLARTEPQPAPPPRASPVAGIPLLPTQAPPPPTQPQETPRPLPPPATEVAKPATRPPTPPQSPEVVKASSPTPPQSPMAGSTQPSPTVETLTPSLKPVVTTRSPTPPRSPEVIKTSSPTPPPSPKSNDTQPSATPMPRPEPEPKRTFEQDTGIKNDGTRTSSNGAAEPPKNNHSSNHNGSSKHAAAAAAKKEEENETTAVIIAGHNLGAHMDFGSSDAHHSRKQQLHDDNMEGKAQTEEGETTKAAIKQKPSITLVNSNVQTVNNSLLVDSSCIFGSPGVHINLTTRKSHPSLLHLDQEQGVDPAPAK